MPAAETEETLFLEKLFRQEYGNLLRYAGAVLRKHGSAYVSDSERAEDVVQEVFSIAWEKRRELMASPSPAGWLYKATVNKVREALRDDRAWVKRLAAVVQEEAPEDSLRGMPEEWEPYLSREEFQLLWRIYVEGRTYQELSQELGIKKSALGMRVRRIKERLRKKIEKS